ncbi:NACHT domain-containing protein [Actinomadura sp. KC06]|uniref:NACHT domain-containing protein n=1 Tax=Actinomadura sp. KC06 TaxID=2530369 RepID=UPI001043C7E1|nr:NACHT domain-containing protein [Actinomadura sp. KC06]TDD31705.1 NACHT domain-containing protein [Actinomadura sp. KC06]
MGRVRLVVRLLLVAIAGLLLAYAINIVTGGTLPAALEPYRAHSWWVTGLLAAIVVAGAVADQWPGRTRTEPADGTATAQDRRNALANVEARVRARLDQSLARTLRAHLELKSAPALVNPPRSWYVERDGQQVDPQASILATFRELDESLLVLGAPGAGKTTLLLELAEALAGEAARDERAPLPVLVELGNWKARGENAQIESWIFDQVHRSYGIGDGLARTWLNGRGLVLLLDGLDEVVEADRRRCARLLNDLQLAHPKLRIAVGSRRVEYQELPERLALRGAIVIQPLTGTEVQRWLNTPGLESLRAAVGADRSLLELLTAPLWLQLTAAVFTDPVFTDPSGTPALTGTIAHRRAQLLDAFFTRMLAGRTTRAQATRLKKHLTVTALALTRNNRTVADPRPLRGTWSQAIPPQHADYLSWRGGRCSRGSSQIGWSRSRRLRSR